MDVQNAASGHLASLRVDEGVFPNDLDSPAGPVCRASSCIYFKQRYANVPVKILPHQPGLRQLLPACRINQCRVVAPGVSVV